MNLNVEYNKLLTIVIEYQSILFEKFEDEFFKYEPRDDKTSDKHLLWMTYEIKFNHKQSLTKKHRWLGYIQGVMVMKGYIDVDGERDGTRDILNGS